MDIHLETPTFSRAIADEDSPAEPVPPSAHDCLSVRIAFLVIYAGRTLSVALGYPAKFVPVNDECQPSASGLAKETEVDSHPLPFLTLDVDPYLREVLAPFDAIPTMTEYELRKNSMPTDEVPYINDLLEGTRRNEEEGIFSRTFPQLLAQRAMHWALQKTMGKVLFCRHDTVPQIQSRYVAEMKNFGDARLGKRNKGKRRNLGF